jgi:phage terminase small subunit
VTGLTPRVERFVREYLIDQNGTQAAIRTGYSERTAAQQASRLLTNAKVSAAIVDGQKSVAERLGITAERVLTEYARLAFLDIRKAFDEDGRLRPIHDLDDDTVAAVSGIEVEDLYEGKGADREHVGRLHKLKLSDKKAALDSLAKHIGLLKDGHPGGLTLNLAGQVHVYLPDNGRDRRD